MKALFICMLLILLVSTGCVPDSLTDGDASKSELVFRDRNGNPIGGRGGDGEAINDLEIFKKTVYPIVKNNTCFSCHGSHQSPKFAVNEPEEAYHNLVSASKVDLTDPESSRIVRKIIDQSHNCWSDCADNANEMLEAVKEWARLSNTTDQGLGNIQTKSVGFPDILNTKIAQTEYGTLILQAEQRTPGVLSGRYQSFIDAKALGQAYIKGPFPVANPITQVSRTGSVNKARCSVPSTGAINNLTNGAYQIREESTHVSSNTRFSSVTGSTVKDGYTPFSYQLSGFLVRPDRRLERAKALLNRSSGLVFGNQLVTIGNFPRITKRPGVLAPDIGDTTVTIGSGNLEILPHFAKWNEVFNNDGTFKAAGNTFVKDDGSSEDVYKLFADGAYEPQAHIVLKELNEEPYLKKAVLYRRLKEGARAYLNSRSGEFSRVRKLDLEYFLSTEPITIALDCRDEWIGQEDQLVDPSRPGRGYRNCDPTDPNYPGRYWYLVYEVTTPKADITPLTYDNSMDQLSLSDDETQIIPARPSDLASGRWFHRIDLFMHMIVNISSKDENSDFTVTFHQGQSGTFDPNETFSPDRSIGNNGELRYDLNRGDENLDLSGVFVGNTAGLDRGLELENFEQTLFPVIRNARCIDCHSTGDQARFAQENSSLAMKIIKENNLVNFVDAGNSFRGRGEGVVHRCMNGTGDSRYDCANDEALKNAFISAIRDWKTANEADSSGDGIQGLSVADRTPGIARYQFQVNEPGAYNIWFRARKSTDNDRKFNYRLLNDRGAPEGVFRNNGGRLNGISGTCRDFDVSFDEWGWSTEGRGGEKGSIGPNGEIILDDFGNPIAVPDNRVYWNLSQGLYTLEIFEDDLGVELDLVALNKVKDLSDEGRLNFQPDIRTRDEKYISNYERKILKYDLSHLVDLEQGEEAYFSIEVEEEFGGQNYIFRSPRFIYNNSRGKFLHVSGIRGLINGKHEFTDATYSQIDAKLGLDRVVTYAPLVTLVPDPSSKENNQFSFVFNKLSIVDGPASELSPAGELPKLPEPRACLELELFKNTVKPILKHVRVVLNSSLNDTINDFPGDPDGQQDSLEFYRCMTCHNETHPFFKMTTFDYNDDILCKQALSRVNFENFYQSTLIRGINGTNNHPKFVFSEELVYEDSSQKRWATHDLADDYLQEFTLHPAPAGYKSKFFNGPFSINRRAELGLPASGFSSLSAADQDKAQTLGQFKGIRYMKIPTDPALIGGYDEFLHFDFLGGIRGERDIIDPNHIPDPGTIDDPLIEIDPIVFDRGRAGRAMYLGPNDLSYVSNPSTYTYDDGRRRYNRLILNLEKTAGEKVAMPKVIDYRDDLPGIQGPVDMERDLERLRTKYREAVINWIRAEDAAYKALP